MPDEPTPTVPPGIVKLIAAGRTMISKRLAGCVLGPVLLVTAATAQSLPEAPGSTVGYATVAEALAALHARPDVKFSVQGGWTIAEDRANSTLWSFAPEGYPAYPAVVKREIKQTKDGAAIQMSVLCHGTKAACDQLVIAFQKMNEAMRQNLSRSGNN